MSNKFDPNSTIPRAAEVRVTMRGVRLTPDGFPVQVSTRSDFIAPELSRPSTLATELDKGLRGWSDYGVKISAPVNGGVIVGRAERELADMTAGHPIRRTTVRRQVSRKRPTTRRWA